MCSQDCDTKLDGGALCKPGKGWGLLRQTAELKELLAFKLCSFRQTFPPVPAELVPGSDHSLPRVPDSLGVSTSQSLPHLLPGSFILHHAKAIFYNKL